ncbi:Uma2 family endonuclease [Sphaerimonospora thailandensis]|uniref:Putative restriction endonuclease domain-containing protein n=1 Tax=Sphaerimonospora thailandensis TaxID=795644 RepID=A0A8J3W050_9ACTN|nr:Uma2 family endonuclease [Sphaerimonospora thailandensis]GIH70790.1 hypothetical protein Mth01_30430 [Sphaerimonospora thailandensis]
MSVAAVVHHLLPDAEIGGSPCPPVDHNEMVRDVEKVFSAAETGRTGSEWQAVHAADLNLADIGDGRTPDLLVVDGGTLVEARKQRTRHLLPAQVVMVMEVTSRGNAVDELPHPGTLRSPLTTGSRYARSGIPHYLLVDRDPRVARVLLYADPDREQGTYGMLAGVWDFGQTVELPEPFGVEISTKLWEPWQI